MDSVGALLWPLSVDGPEWAVMEFMGWSNTAMTKRYQHITAVMRNDIAKRLSGFLWQKSQGERAATTGRCPACGQATPR